MTHIQIILFSILFIFNLTVCGQKIEYLKLYTGVSFMPAGGYYRETYEQSGKKLSHFSKRLFYKTPNKIIKTKLPIYKNFDLVIKDFDSLIKLTSFTFSLDKSTIEKLKTDTSEKSYHHLNDIDIDNFFSDNNKITLSLSDVKVDSMDEYTVYDGRPFIFYLKYKKFSEDTIQFKYSANMDDGVKSRNIKDWLPLYILISNYKLFDTNRYITSFFDDKHFYSILYRFIKWRKQ